MTVLYMHPAVERVLLDTTQKIKVTLTIHWTVLAYLKIWEKLSIHQQLLKIENVCECGLV